MPRNRRLVFSFTLALLVLVGCEALAWLGLSITGGQIATWGRLAARRAEVLGASSANLEEAITLDVADLPRRHRDEQVIHPFLGFVMDPRRHPAAKRYARNSDAVELGFPWNSERIFQPDDPQRVVVAILGGSVAVGWVQEQHDAIKKTVDALWGREKYRVVVLNLAAFGYKQPQQLATLNYFLALGARIDVVINLDGFNEVALPPAELIPQGAFVHFPQSWVARVAPFDPELQAQVGKLAFMREQRKVRAERFSASPWRMSFLAGALWATLDGGAARQQQLLEQELAAWDATKLGYAAHGPHLEGTTPESAMAEIAALWQRASWQMHLLCQGLGIRYFHFLQPNQYDPGSKPLSEEERRLFYQADHPYRPGVEAGYPLLRQAGKELAQRGVAFTDLSQLFAATTETVYVDSCCHLNPQGSELLGKAIAASLSHFDLRNPTP